MSLIAHVNVVVALVLMVAILAALTPVLSPERLSANSQYQMALKPPAASPDARNDWSTPFHYLRFNTGVYGRGKLQALASLQNHADADRIRRLAAAAIALTKGWEPINVTTPEELRTVIAKLPIYPAGRTLDPMLVDVLVAELSQKDAALMVPARTPDNSAGVFVDLNGDGVEEFVLLQMYSGAAFESREGHWVRVGAVTRQPVSTEGIKWSVMRDKLARGDFSTLAPKWKDLTFGEFSYRVEP